MNVIVFQGGVFISLEILTWKNKAAVSWISKNSNCHFSYGLQILDDNLQDVNYLSSYCVLNENSTWYYY